MCEIDPWMLLLKPRVLKKALLFQIACSEDKNKSFYSGEHLKYRRIVDTFPALSEEESLSRYRFYKDDINRLAQALQLPQEMSAKNKTKWGRQEGLLMLLRRLSYPSRYEDLVYEFGRHPSDCSIIFNDMLYFINERWGHLLDTMNQPWLSEDNLRTFSDVIYDNGCPLDTCFGFIDGTLVKIARPIHNQRDVYNGKDRAHGLKYQSVVVPNGLIANLYGPVEGRLHDSTLLRQSGILQSIANIFSANGRPLVLYGDKAYPVSDRLITPYRGVGLNGVQNHFNLTMNAQRITVEWGFGKVSTLFPFVNYAPNLKLYLQPVGLYYRVATLLTNCHTCLYRSQTGDYFNLQPLTLEEYLQ